MSRLNLNLDAATRTRSGCVPRSPARPLTPLSTQLQVWHTALRCTRFLETVVECCDLAVRVVSAEEPVENKMLERDAEILEHGLEHCSRGGTWAEEKPRRHLSSASQLPLVDAYSVVPSVCLRVIGSLERGLGLEEFRSSRNRAMKTATQRRLWQFVHGTPFQITMSCVIVLNAFILGLHADAELSANMRNEQLDAKWTIIDGCFCAIFSIEVILRALAERGLFLYGREGMWNAFDTILVTVSISDIIIGSTGLSNLKVARMMRFVRFVRLVRLARAVRGIESLRLFVLSIFASGMSLTWCCLIISLIVYFFASVFLSGVTEYFRRPTRDAAQEASMAEFYGSVMRAMATLFMAISGGVDWRDAMQPLVAIHWAYEPTFLFFIFFMFFGVLNIVIGAFVTTAGDISKKDRDFLVNAELESVGKYAQKIKDFFAEADNDNSGKLSLGEFEDHLQNPKVAAFFTSLELDVSRAHRLFHLLDTDGSNEVGFDEFLDGCLRLKGPAKSLDVNMLVYETEKLQRQMAKIIEEVENGRRHSGGNRESPRYGGLGRGAMHP